MAIVPEAAVSISEEDVTRARLYGLLGNLLARPADPATLEICGSLHGDDTPLGRALGALGETARTIDPVRVTEEYQDLFIGVGRGELMPYGSFYLTGFLHEKPLADLRTRMAELGIQRRDDISEPEDHVAALCEMMAGLISGGFGAPADLDTQRQFFSVHIGSWARRFFEDLERAKAAAFYMPVGTIGRLFMEIEAQAFVLED